MTPSRPAAPAAPAERHGRAGARHAGSGRVRLHPVLRAVADALHVHHLCVSAKLTLAADAPVLCVSVFVCSVLFDEIKYEREMGRAAPWGPSCLTADSGSGGAGTYWAFSWFSASRLASAVCSAHSGIQNCVAAGTKWIYWVDYQLGQSVTGPDRV